jgi:threonine/homoserine/homoserine lactone efflux protein
MPSLSTYAVFLATAIVLLLVPGPAVLYAALGFLSDSIWALAAGTVADRLRGSTGIARVQRWVGGSVLVGLGILAVVWTPSRAR